MIYLIPHLWTLYGEGDILLYTQTGSDALILIVEHVDIFFFFK